MTIQLKKGNSISLKKEAPGLKKIMLGLGWDMSAQAAGLFGFLKGGSNVDLDSAVLCLDANGKFGSSQDLVYYANLKHKSGAIHHQGDNVTGEGAGDDEQILVDLDQLPAEISSLLFTVNIYAGQQRKQDFSRVKNAFVRLVDCSNNNEIAKYQLSGETYQGQTVMLMAELRREDNGWQMKALGEGVDVRDLNELTKRYS